MFFFSKLKTKDDEFDKPTYFQFLTCMMFYVFVKENINAAIIEVGIGGEYDHTNIIQLILNNFNHLLPYNFVNKFYLKKTYCMWNKLDWVRSLLYIRKYFRGYCVAKIWHN